MDDVNRCLLEIKKELGELKAKVDMIIKRLDKMEKKYNRTDLRSITLQEKLEETIKDIEESKQEKIRKTDRWIIILASIIGGISGVVTNLLFSILLQKI